VVRTVHQYKGLEESAVIVLDTLQRRYPLLHPTWIFRRIFGDTIEQLEAEERRLFYVAMTRAKDALVLMTDTGAQSPYLSEITRRAPLTLVSWADLPPPPSLNGPHVEVRVFGYHVRKQLQRQGYCFEPKGGYWYTVMPAHVFSFDTLLEQPWLTSGVTIEVYAETGRLLHRHRMPRQPAGGQAVVR
jgi:DNA helicase-4